MPERSLLLTGATGFVGGAVRGPLAREGWRTRCLTRDAARAKKRQPALDWVQGDVADPASCAGALVGCQAALYLVHGIGEGGDYHQRELAAAATFAQAAAKAGVARIVYLGGVAPKGAGSEHLRSRLDVGEALRAGPVTTVELRASMIVGHGSLSWLIVRDLAARLPFMVLPRWLKSRTQPVAIDDVVIALVRALELPLPASAWFDIPGPVTLSGREILEATAQVLGLPHPRMIELPLLSPRLSSLWVRFVTRADWSVAREVVVGLAEDLLAQDDRYWELIGHSRRRSFAEAARLALEAERGDSRVLGVGDHRACAAESARLSPAKPHTNRDLTALSSGPAWKAVPPVLMSNRAEPPANEPLRASDERFRLLVESIDDYAIFMLDAGGIITTWNRGAERIKGYGADEIIGQHSSRFYLEEEVRAGVCERELEQAAREGRFEREGWRRRKDGSRFWASVVITAIRDPGNGSLLGFSKITVDLTQRRLTEEALRESEERFRLTIDEAPIGMALVSLDGRFVRVNRAFCEVVGYQAAELMNLTFREITHPEDVDTDLALAGQLARGEIPRCQFEKRYLRKDGTVVDTTVSVSILRDAAGAPLYYISQIEDSTERKRVEKELRDANAFLDAIVENIPLMLFIKESASLRFVRFNRAGEELLGWPRQSLVGKNDFDFWPRDQAEFFIRKDRETAKRGKVVEIDEEPIQTRHQGVRILRTKKVPILDPSGNPLYLLGISEDITERRRIEKERRLLAEVNVALAASLDYEQTLATVTELAVQSVADWCGVEVTEEHGHIRRLKVASAEPANAALCSALERMPPYRELPHFARSALESRRPIVIEHLTPQHLESFAQGPEHLQALRATGIISIIGAPLLLRGKPLGVLLFGSSNPDRVYGQDDLAWAEALADRCAVAIENARLYRASVEATHLRDQVLGVVAHDLRNPLATILMQTSISKSGKPMEVIRRAATRMNRLIQDLLDVSLIETGQLPIQRARLSGGELAVEAVETQKVLATSSSVELRLDVERGVPEVWGERDRLLQVFENLIGNAIKFSTAGGLITVGAASRDQEVLFWVADSGCGIAPGSLPHVFDRFWQATKSDRRGAGLGLPIAKGIVEAHGGHLWVESTLGRGSIFFFSLPRARPTADQPSGVSA